MTERHRRRIDLDDLLILTVLVLAGRLFLAPVEKPFLLVFFCLTGLIWLRRGARISPVAIGYVAIALIWVGLRGIAAGFADWVTVSGFFVRLGIGIFVVGAVRDPLERFCTWVLRLAALSLPLFAAGVVFPRLVEVIYQLTPHAFRVFGGLQVADTLTGGWRRATWLFYTFSPDRHFRNHGFMWEPAAFGLVVTLALWVRILSGRGAFDRANLLLLTAALTTVSTTTYVCILPTVIFMLLVRYRGLGLIAMLLALPLVLFAFANTGFLMQKITAEWDAGYSAHMQHTLSRTASAQLDLAEFATAPFLGIGLSSRTRPPGADRLPSNNGLTDYLDRFGLLMSGLMLFILARNMRAYFDAPAVTVLTFTLVILLFSWAEKFFEMPLFYMFAFAGAGSAVPLHQGSGDREAPAAAGRMPDVPHGRRAARSQSAPVSQTNFGASTR